MFGWESCVGRAVDKNGESEKMIDSTTLALRSS